MNKKISAIVFVLVLFFSQNLQAYKSEAKQNREAAAKVEASPPKEAMPMTPEEYLQAKKDAHSDMITGGVMTGIGGGLIVAGVIIGSVNPFSSGSNAYRWVVGGSLMGVGSAVTAAGIVYLAKGGIRRGSLKEPVAVSPIIDPSKNIYGLNLAVNF